MENTYYILVNKWPIYYKDGEKFIDIGHCFLDNKNYNGKVQKIVSLEEAIVHLENRISIYQGMKDRQKKARIMLKILKKDKFYKELLNEE